ncbi:immunity 49 family protein [Kitasatospora sp. P5_F3]
MPIALLRDSGAQFDEYIYAWVGALQAYRRQGPQLIERLSEAIEGADPDVVRVADHEVLLKLLCPPIAAFHQLVQRDGKKFNAALARGLELHREYWTADEDRVEDSNGLVALSLLGIACLAHDSGLTVEVESDYLPKNLLLRSWVGWYEA